VAQPLQEKKQLFCVEEHHPKKIQDRKGRGIRVPLSSTLEYPESPKKAATLEAV